ncbi:MAG TPA: adenine deaminase [Candidatus Galloscillospira excrementipullorum]|nr:adenine deaminase [Candidatus Galloscillospira excrementipullorum]
MKLYPKDRRALLEAAMGRRPCDLAVENVRFVNVFTGEIYPAVVYVLDGFVAYVEEGGRADPALAHQVVDGQGAYLTPGFVDPHIHIESTMLTPRAFAAAVVPHGTTTVVTDPHEIANVLGEQAVVYMHDAAEDLPMRQLVDIPSCVPAVPGLENSGAEFDAGTVHRLAKLPRVTGLAEVMDFLAVAQGEQRMLDMLDAAQQEGLYVQGHVPVSDKRLLSAYAIGGPTTCHETREGEDAVSKLRLGLRIDARESSIAKDVEKIYSQVRRLRYLDRVSLCTDDREAHDILENGHMDNALRKAVACGMDGVDALRCATLHPALESGLSNLGAVAPGYAADFLLLEDLKDFRVRAVYYGGRLVARDGVLTQEITPKTFALEQMDTMRVPPLKREDFDIAAPVEQGVVKVNVLHFAELEKSNTTRCVEEIPVRDGKLDLSQQPDLCYVKIVNRHGKGTVCSGVTRGFGLKEGAFASTVSHDSHNLCVVYRDADSAYEACRALVACRGGMCCAMPGQQTVTLPLPVAGLMSTLPCGELARQVGEMKQALRRAGMPQSNPLVRIVTMALPVIPEAKYTDLGLVDVYAKKVLPLFPEA